MKFYTNFFIDGKWVEPLGGGRHEVVNPATERAFATIAMASELDVDKAVAAAKSAFVSFSKFSVEQRLELLLKVRDGLVRRKDEIARILTEEMGAPIEFSRSSQTYSCIAHVEAMIDILRLYKFEERSGTTLITQEPIGVVGLITPWNWPLNQIVCKVIPALAAGCTVVLKPSELAPLDAVIFAEILEEAGLPKGVFNLINGDGPTVGGAISRHADVQMMSFTGSTRAGIQVAKAAADTVKRVAQELGGKSSNIILDDADIADAVAAGVRQCFSNSGQSCDAPTHMLVPRATYALALAVAAETANASIVGDPFCATTELGPLANELQYRRVQAMIQSGIDDGARLICGGLGRPEHLTEGYYAKPTVFADVTLDMTIVKEEIFGPVLVITPYENVDQAIAIANASEYGLAGYVQSKDLVKARAVGRQIRAGSIYLNYPEWDVMAPFGGFKHSGNGREGGHHSLAEYLETKSNVGYFSVGED